MSDVCIIVLAVTLAATAIILFYWYCKDEGTPEKGKQFHEMGTKDFDVTKYI